MWSVACATVECAGGKWNQRLTRTARADPKAPADSSPAPIARASRPASLAPRLGDLYMSYVLGPDLGEFGQVVVPTGILRIEGIPQGQRPIVRVVKQYGE